MPLPDLTLNAVVPEGARDLDPLIIATGLTVDQQIDGDTDMENGGSITRRLTAKISGTTPFLVPELIPDNPDPLLRAYPKEPRFTENEDRGVLSGQRVDEVVYLAQDGGQTQLPSITIRWYNLDGDQVETINIDPVDLTLARPKWQPPDTETILRFAVWLAAFSLFIWLAIRFLRPRVDRWRQVRWDAFLSSPDYALGELKKALQDHDIAAAYAALEMWKSRCGMASQTTSLDQHLAQIGAARYAAHPDTKTEDWAAALSALASLKQSAQAPANPLPPLNPAAQH